MHRTTFLHKTLRVVASALFCLSAGVIHAEEQAKKIPVIFDTDFAIDDWSALLLLGMHSGINLLGVTANGAGETRCSPAMKNIPSLLDLTPTGETVVACGDDYPLDGFFCFS